jgi:hypothetical protein
MTPETEAQVLRSLGAIETKLDLVCADYSKTKEKVERHERAYQAGKFLSVPLLAGLHLALKHIFTKF